MKFKKNKTANPIFLFIGIAILVDIGLALLFWAVTFPLYYWINNMTVLWKVLTFLLMGTIFMAIKAGCLFGQMRFCEYLLNKAEKGRGKDWVLGSAIVFFINSILFSITLWRYAYKGDAVMIILLIIFTAVIMVVNSMFRLPDNV